jgi:hypothetical protein
MIIDKLCQLWFIIFFKIVSRIFCIKQEERLLQLNHRRRTAQREHKTNRGTAYNEH